MKRRITALLLIGVTALCLFGCKPKEKEFTGYDMQKIVGNVESVKFNDELLYNNMTDYGADEMLASFGIDTTLLEEYVMRMPMINIRSSMYAVLKPKEGKGDEVKAQLEDFVKKYSQQWSLYLPDQYELVENAMFVEKNGYLILIISYDNDSVMTAIDSSAL